jgi:hypothetical protein
MELRYFHHDHPDECFAKVRFAKFLAVTEDALVSRAKASEV